MTRRHWAVVVLSSLGAAALASGLFALFALPVSPEVTSSARSWKPVAPGVLDRAAATVESCGGRRGYRVLRASVEQEGATLALDLAVIHPIDLEMLDELADCAVRTAKRLSPDDPPGNRIGTGAYDYTVRFYSYNDVLPRGTATPEFFTLIEYVKPWDGEHVKRR